MVKICEKYELKNPKIWTGIGSTVGGTFENGNIVQEIPTELMVFEGSVEGKTAIIDTVLIDAEGNYHFGKLEQGQNPVLILFELVLVEGE